MLYDAAQVDHQYHGDQSLYGQFRFACNHLNIISCTAYQVVFPICYRIRCFDSLLSLKNFIQPVESLTLWLNRKQGHTTASSGMGARQNVLAGSGGAGCQLSCSAEKTVSVYSPGGFKMPLKHLSRGTNSEIPFEHVQENERRSWFQVANLT